MSPVSVVSVSPVSVMSPVTVVGVSGPVLSVRSPLVFGPEDVVGPVSLGMPVVKPTTFAFVHFLVLHLLLLGVAAIRMHHAMSVVGDDEDHLQSCGRRPERVGGSVNSAFIGEDFYSFFDVKVYYISLVYKY